MHRRKKTPDLTVGNRVRDWLIMMFPTSDPAAAIVGSLALGGLALLALWRMIVWVRDAPVRPDPWDAEIGEKLSDPEAVEICPHCLTEQPPTAWFCKKCGRAVGPYNNLMPYVCVFSEGEVFRNGVTGRFRNRKLVLTGFILISLSTYLVFALIYLSLLWYNWQHANRGSDFVEPQKNT
jgi:ribosomal protein L40E